MKDHIVGRLTSGHCVGDGGECEDGGDDGCHLKSDGGHEQDDEPTTGENVCPILFRSFKYI